MQKIEEGELLAYTSTLTWDEVVWTIRKFMGRDESITQGQKLLGFINLHFIPVDENILSQAQALMSNYNLKPRDSIHVSSAIDRKLKIIISDDVDIEKLRKLKEYRLHRNCLLDFINQSRTVICPRILLCANTEFSPSANPCKTVLPADASSPKSAKPFQDQHLSPAAL